MKQQTDGKGARSLRFWSPVTSSNRSSDGEVHAWSHPCPLFSPFIRLWAPPHQLVSQAAMNYLQLCKFKDRKDTNSGVSEVAPEI